MQARLRPFAGDDLEAVVGLSLLAWEPVFASFRRVLGPEIYAHLYPDWRAQQREVVEQACAAGATTIVWVAEVGGVVAGFVAYLANAETRIGEVYLLAVHPGYQQRGIGTALNQLALEQLREAGMTLVEVGTGGDEGHAPARRAYEKAGYTAFPQVRYFQRLQ
jgi:ribosomal protein S18 acetylase RimI-like enzyme